MARTVKDVTIFRVRNRRRQERTAFAIQQVENPDAGNLAERVKKEIVCNRAPHRTLPRYRKTLTAS